MLITDIDHVQIAAPQNCEADARYFFGELLGLPELEKPSALKLRGGCWFLVGTRQLHIGVEENFTPAPKAHPAFATDDIEELFTRLSNAGVNCKWDNSIVGLQRFYADDPWENRLEFTAPTFLTKF